MKNHNFLPFLLLSLASNPLISQSNIQQTLSVNSTGAAPAASAQLDVSATDKGMLVPRMTSAQRTAIASPATGLLVFDTTTGGFWFYNGTAWANLSAPKTLQDTDGNTKIQVEESPDEDIIRFDLGGTENLVLRKNPYGAVRLELLDALYFNTFFGKQAGAFNTTGYANTALGENALVNNTEGFYNTASGLNALSSNTTGFFNTAQGANALNSNTTGAYNTALGESALRYNTIGSDNTAVGRSALSDNTGSFNTAMGKNALRANTGGSLNTATGREALFFNTTGTGNTAQGANALYLNITGSRNTANGQNALRANTSSGNTANGAFALYSNTTGYSNVALGAYSLYNNTDRSNLVAVGDSALYNNGINVSSPFDATGNTAVGSKALFANTNGSGNNCVVASKNQIPIS